MSKFEDKGGLDKSGQTDLAKGFQPTPPRTAESGEPSEPPPTPPSQGGNAKK